VVVPERVLVFSPHPDDETISCGGIIYKYAKLLSSRITVLLVKEAARRRLREFQMALDVLGADPKTSRCLSLPVDEGLDDEIVGKLTNAIREVRPQWILLPHPEDRHRTHRIVAQAVLEAVYHAASSTYLDEIRYYLPHQLKAGLFKEDGPRPLLRPWLPMGVFYYESPSFRFEYRSQVQAPMVVVDVSGEPYEAKFRILDSIYRETLEDIESHKRWAQSVADQRGALIYSLKGEALGVDTHHVPLRMLPV
jgi:LmbE family N-acetylglucosaminyl deacetylase